MEIVSHDQSPRRTASTAGHNREDTGEVVRTGPEWAQGRENLQKWLHAPLTAPTPSPELLGSLLFKVRGDRRCPNKSYTRGTETGTRGQGRAGRVNPISTQRREYEGRWIWVQRAWEGGAGVGWWNRRAAVGGGDRLKRENLSL